MSPSRLTTTSTKLVVPPHEEGEEDDYDKPFYCPTAVGGGRMLLPAPPPCLSCTGSGVAAATDDDESSPRVHYDDDDDTDPAAVELLRESVSSASSSNDDGDDLLSLSSSSVEGDEDLVTFQTLDDESDYQAKLLFRKYHGPVADLGGGGDDSTNAAAAAAAAQANRGRSPKPKDTVNVDDPVTLLEASGGGGGMRFYPFWARRVNSDKQQQETNNIEEVIPTSLAAVEAGPDSAPEATTRTAGSPPKEKDDDVDEDEGYVCFPRFGAPTCGGGFGTTDDVSMVGGAGSGVEQASVEHPLMAAGSATTKTSAPKLPPVEDTVKEEVDEEELSTTVASASQKVDPSEDGKGDGGAGGGNVRGQLTCAANAIDQTVEAILGLCVPEIPMVCAGGCGMRTTSAAEADSVENENAANDNEEDDATPPPEPTETITRKCPPKDYQARFLWRHDDDDDDRTSERAPAEGWATFPPKVEVAPHVDDTHSSSNDDTIINRNTRLIVSSTTEERDDTRVVTIVGMDQVLDRYCLRRRGRTASGSLKNGTTRFGRWWGLRGPASKSLASLSLQPPHDRSEWGSLIAASRKRRSLALSRSWDGGSVASSRRRKAAKHRSSPWWFQRFRPLRGAARGLVANKNDTSSLGREDDDDEEEQSFRSRSTLSSKFAGGDDSILLEWPERRASSFRIESENANIVQDNDESSIHDHVCHFALKDIDVYSMCSVTSSLASRDSFTPFLSPSWFWSLVPVRELKNISKALGIDPAGDEDAEDEGNGHGQVTTRQRQTGEVMGEEGDDGAAVTAPAVQVFAPIHVKQGERFLEEAPPSPPLSTITMMTLPHKKKHSRRAARAAPVHAAAPVPTTTTPVRVEERQAEPGGRIVDGMPIDSAGDVGSFVTEDERTVTDGDTSIHTIRIHRIPAVDPLVSTPHPTSSTTSSPWQPGTSARSGRDGPHRFKAKSLADDLSQHEESQSPSARTTTTTTTTTSTTHRGGAAGGPPRRRAGDGGSSVDRNAPAPASRSPQPQSPLLSRRSRRRPYSFAGTKTSTSTSPSSPRTPPSSPKRASSDHRPLLPKTPPEAAVFDSPSRALAASPTYYSKHDETVTFGSDGGTSRSPSSSHHQGFVTTTLRIRRIPTAERVPAGGGPPPLLPS